MDHTEILSVKLCALSESEILARLSSLIEKTQRCAVFTPNTQMLLAAKRNARICALLNSATLNIPDGVGVRVASRLQSKRELAKTSGIDIGERLLAICAKRSLRVFLLGARDGVAEKAARELCRKYRGLKVCGVQHGYFEKRGAENDRVIEKINSCAPDLLIVCFGFPLQEAWVRANLKRLTSVRLALCLGGALDVWSGKLRRAPRCVSASGLEWLWRVAIEPRRAKIFLDIPLFLLAILREKKTVQRNKPSHSSASSSLFD